MTQRHNKDDPYVIQQRDKEKQRNAYRLGITLIVVPFWWNETAESLASSICLMRPDVPLPPSLIHGTPIPKEMTLVERRKADYNAKRAVAIS